MSGSVAIDCGSETDLLSAVANVGPIAVAVDGSSNAFRVNHLYICIISTQVCVILFVQQMPKIIEIAADLYTLLLSVSKVLTILSTFMQKCHDYGC